MSSSNQAQKTAAEPAEAVPARERRRRPSVGGFGLKLDAPERKGWVRRWVNGDPLNIRRMEELGYSLVAETAAEGNARTEGLGTRISRHAGKDENGKPYQTVLMETPEDLHKEGEAEKESGRQAFEETIRRGLKTEDTPDGAYLPGRSSINHSG